MRWTGQEQQQPDEPDGPDEPDVAEVRAFVDDLVNRQVLDRVSLRKAEVYHYLDYGESYLAFDLVLWHLGDVDHVTDEDRAAAVELARKFEYDLFEGGDGIEDGTLSVEPSEYVDSRLRHQPGG